MALKELTKRSLSRISLCLKLKNYLFIIFRVQEWRGFPEMTSRLQWLMKIREVYRSTQCQQGHKHPSLLNLKIKIGIYLGRIKIMLCLVKSFKNKSKIWRNTHDRPFSPTLFKVPVKVSNQSKNHSVKLLKTLLGTSKKRKCIRNKLLKIPKSISKKANKFIMPLTQKINNHWFFMRKTSSVNSDHFKMSKNNVNQRRKNAKLAKLFTLHLKIKIAELIAIIGILSLILTLSH